MKFAIAIDVLTLVMIEAPRCYSTRRSQVRGRHAGGHCRTYLSLKTTLYMPALAVDAPQPTLINAWRDTQGHAWKIVLVVICTFFPP